jgi:hypothetical protein
MLPPPDGQIAASVGCPWVMQPPELRWQVWDPPSMQPTLSKVSAVIPHCPRCGSTDYVAKGGSFGREAELQSLTCRTCGEDILPAYAMFHTGLPPAPEQDQCRGTPRFKHDTVRLLKCLANAWLRFNGRCLSYTAQWLDGDRHDAQR